MGNSTGTPFSTSKKQPQKPPMVNYKLASKPLLPAQDERCFERGYN